MNKIHSLSILIFSFLSFSLFGSQDQSLSSIKMAFALKKNPKIWGADIVAKEIQECISYLKKLSKIQEKRDLTLEEITLGLQAAIYIFSSEYEQHSGQIHIIINEKEKIVLPFSSEALISLLTQSIEVASKAEQLNKNN